MKFIFKTFLNCIFALSLTLIASAGLTMAAAPRRQSRLSGSVKLSGLFSSSGKITKVEVVSNPGGELTKLAIKAAEQIQFLPAEKDGKLISTYKFIEYSFSTY